jgi:hypothetical protein
MNSYYTWRTKKEGNQFKFVVSLVVSRSTPNESGQFADTQVVKTGFLKTRPRAKVAAQHWQRYFRKSADLDTGVAELLKTF